MISKRGTKLVTREIKRLLRALNMTINQIPNIIQDDKTKSVIFLRQLLKGKQNIQKQSVMVVGQGQFPSSSLSSTSSIVLINHNNQKMLGKRH